MKSSEIIIEKISTIFHPAYRFSKVVSFWIFLLIRLELGLWLGLGVRGGVGFVT